MSPKPHEHGEPIPDWLKDVEFKPIPPGPFRMNTKPLIPWWRRALGRLRWRTRKENA